MALLQTSLIWVVYAIMVAVLVAVASIFIYAYQTPRDRCPSVILTCIFAVTTLLATVLLVPVDVALVSSTNSPALGRRQDWATQKEVDRILLYLKVGYYFLYSLDALLCLIVIPFIYFWYEEYDEVASEAGEQSLGQRFWAAFRYTVSFLAIVVVLFLVGFFAPTAKDGNGGGLDYFKNLLTQSRGERALTFALGLLITIGLCFYVLYTSTGLALFPITLIKEGPSVSSPTLQATTAVQLGSNRERQRQLEGRCRGNPGLLSSKDRRELDTLVREERTLVRRQRLADEAEGKDQTRLMRLWLKIEAIFRPFRLLSGVILSLVALIIWISMLLTAIDKAKNSFCKQQCGYILGHINVFNPINWVLVQSAKAFPVDYVIFTMLVLFLFSSSIVGISAIGIRFLWIKIFQIRKGHTSPQALLLATAMLMLIILALNYSTSIILAPQYATYGPQTFCDRELGFPEKQPDCSGAKHLIRPCSEVADSLAAKQVCTPSVASTFLNRVTINFPFFGAMFFWAQFAFLGIYLFVMVTALLCSPKLDERQLDEDAEEAEEESLLASTGGQIDTIWQDITTRLRQNDVGRAGA
ncbi:lysosomal cobalamin transporter [Aspergillus nomiae NRRL 13137]|uniref:Probable lysosomal cobalamin transporter n=1 Tax=Aspergillus nomiae NRRL (strain ATCC 15546 / NRRL 13137 / CBS 260.88 / M93) TaxID=1509407 RepID=A0A0L1ILA7_ASPN3|nr:lysosomal cobalamin transporter [Aspergillus nomiae NRRL 13137]KNG80364.1 lysosomal cobalamin transporter [Aspergillus nomiae NRRL 13137]